MARIQIEFTRGPQTVTVQLHKDGEGYLKFSDHMQFVSKEEADHFEINNMYADAFSMMVRFYKGARELIDLTLIQEKRNFLTQERAHDPIEEKK